MSTQTLTLGPLVARIDDTLHQKARLGIMAALVSGEEKEFKDLRETLNLSDGNLSTHISHLEKAGFVAVRKGFVGKKPQTTISITEAGLGALQGYVDALAEVFERMSA